MSYVDGSAVNITVLFRKVQTCHMLTAQPSTYDMFGLIELFGRKLQSVNDINIVEIRHIESALDFFLFAFIFYKRIINHHQLTDYQNTKHWY